MKLAMLPFCKMFRSLNSRDCGGDSAYPVECPSAIAGPGGSGAYYGERAVVA